jgi:DNA-binding transcriptional MocR family regulator
MSQTPSLLQLVLRPGMLELGWGHPDMSLLPVAEMQEANASALRRYGAMALTYGVDRGAGPLLEWLRTRTGQTDGRTPGPDEISLTAGNSQGLELICTLFTSPGDVVLVENPTYHLAVRILRDHPLELVPVARDSQGISLSALQEAVERLRATGKRPRLLYTIPTFHNPTGADMSLEQRRALVEWATREDVLLVEDDVYRELAYDAPSLPSLWSLAPPGRVLRLGSFSKSLAPGLRLGWLTADAASIQRAAGCGLIDSGGSLNHFTALTVAEFCAAGHFERQVQGLRTAYRERRDTLLAALARHVPAGVTWQVPAGGYFLWLNLPDTLETPQVLKRAEEAGLSFLPGARFFLDGRGGHHALRLCFSLYPPAQLARAAELLGEVIRASAAGG